MTMQLPTNVRDWIAYIHLLMTLTNKVYRLPVITLLSRCCRRGVVPLAEQIADRTVLHHQDVGTERDEKNGTKNNNYQPRTRASLAIITISDIT
jgi:hypothetical protein